MPTFNGWNVITAPTTPAPKDIKFSSKYYAAASKSAFTGNQQIQDWQSAQEYATVSLPAMAEALGVQWATFLRALKGPVNVFQFPASWSAQMTWTYPAGFSPTGYWRLKIGTTADFSLSDAKIYGFSFELEEAK